VPAYRRGTSEPLASRTPTAPEVFMPHTRAPARLAVLMVATAVLLRRIVGMVGCGPAPDAKDVEIAVLRHQLAVVRRQDAPIRDCPGPGRRGERARRSWTPLVT
jgi:hypothetical protein